VLTPGRRDGGPDNVESRRAVESVGGLGGNLISLKRKSGAIIWQGRVVQLQRGGREDNRKKSDRLEPKNAKRTTPKEERIFTSVAMKN